MRCATYVTTGLLACITACGVDREVDVMNPASVTESGLNVGSSVTEGVYALTSVNSNLALDMANVSSADNAGAIQWSYHGATNQQWLFMKTTSGLGFSILNYHSDKALQPLGASGADAAPIVQLPLTQSNVQTWKAQPASGGAYYLINVQTGKCLDVTSASAKAGASAIQYPCHSGSSQMWRLSPAFVPAAQPSPGVTKRGVATYNPGPNANASIKSLGLSWYYDWNTGPVPGIDPNKVEFVPMYHDAGHVTQDVSAYQILLGFNEPDQAGQANMTPEQAIALWPKLVATGLRLGSPATANGDDAWFQSFMTQAQNQNLRVDFIAAHWYAGQNANFDVASNVAQLQYMLTGLHNHYSKPVWLTEFSMINFGSGPALPSIAIQTQYAIAATAMLNSLPFVERYAWYTLHDNGTEDLADPNGVLTRVGQSYSNAP